MGFDLTELYVPAVSAEKFSNAPTSTADGQREWVDGKFLRGPIPLSWLSRLCRLNGGKVVATGLAIWFQAGLQRAREGIRLTSKGLKRFGVTRQAKWEALKALEVAGLIAVERKGKKSPLVTVLSPDGRDRRYLKGPIPLAWLEPACKLGGGKVLATALAVWFQAGLRDAKKDLKVPSDILADFGVDRAAKKRSLEKLEAAGLIAVEKKENKEPLITILTRQRSASLPAGDKE
jgi:hypothetical protein